MVSRGDVFAAARRVVHQAGIELRLFNPLRDDPELRIATICRALEVDLLVDVGASYGFWAQRVRRAGYQGDIVSFEPHPAVYSGLHAKAVLDDGWSSKQLAIAADAGTLELKMAAGTDWSSLLPAADPTFGPTQTVANAEVSVVRLDAFLANDLHRRLFLKLDAQGYELEALRSAEGIADRLVAGKAEVLLEDIYKGQPTLAEFLSGLQDLGFHVVGFEHGYIKSDGCERYLDVLFTA
jgi:FkbM family methyltransferase